MLILPQRQTALVAKQAAEIDVLSGGRLRLGVGVGWNAVEYEGLDKDFTNRGARCEEQIALLRGALDRAGRSPSTGAGTRDRRGRDQPAAGAAPDPDLDRRLRRGDPCAGSAEMGDGWFPWREPDERMRAAIGRIRDYASEAGRDPAAIGIEPQLNVGRGTPTMARLRRRLARARRHPPLPQHHGQRLHHPGQHLAALTRAAEELGVTAAPSG